jgi:hypothetical protein
VRAIFVVACLVVAFVCEPARAGVSHACSSHAIDRAKDLLRIRLCPKEEAGDKDVLSFCRRDKDKDKDKDLSDTRKCECLDKIGGWSVDDTAKKIGTVPSIHGRRRYDVLQVWGYVDKGGRYRMRLIYTVVGGQCVLVGEEIFEDTAL